MAEAKILPKRKHKFQIKNSASCLMDPFSFRKQLNFSPHWHLMKSLNRTKVTEVKSQIIASLLVYRWRGKSMKKVNVGPPEVDL